MATDIPARPLGVEGWAHLAELTAHPYIPERDDEPEPRGISRLDVPAEQVAADAKALRLKAGRLAEQRHAYYDLDPDSTCCPDGFVCVTCLPREEAGS